MKLFMTGLAFATAAVVALAQATGNPVPLPPAQVVVATPAEEAALWVDAVQKSYTAQPGEETCVFAFAVKNTSQREITINQVRTSCGCTIAKLPSQPWKLAPGAGGDITLTVDLRGKSGTLIKTATIDLATGYKNLTFQVNIPAGPAGDMGAMNRERNIQLAAKNRQAVFQGDCARCHLEPTKGQVGVGLYVTACTICHEAEHRATMVPDLHALKRPMTREDWRTMIAQGKPGSLMPAFAQEHGGPLTPAQIDSLVEYLVTEFAGKEQPSAKASQQ